MSTEFIFDGHHIIPAYTTDPSLPKVFTTDPVTGNWLWVDDPLGPTPKVSIRWHGDGLLSMQRLRTTIEFGVPLYESIALPTPNPIRPGSIVFETDLLQFVGDTGISWINLGGGAGGSGIQSLNGQTGALFPDQFFINDANVIISSGGGNHFIGWTGFLPLTRGGLGYGPPVNSGGIPYFDSTATADFSATLDSLVVGGGAGAAPFNYAGDACPGGQAVVSIDNVGTVTCAPVGTGTVTGSGTQNTLPKWDVSGTNLVDSQVTDDGTTISLGGNLFAGDPTSFTGALWGTSSNVFNTLYAFSFGDGTLVQNCEACFALGEVNTVDGFVGGGSATGTAEGSFALGNSNQVLLNGASSSASGAIGGGNVVTGDSAFAFGNGITVGNRNTVAVGKDIVTSADNALYVGVSNTSEIKITSNLVELGAPGAPSVELLFNGSTSGTVGFQAPAVIPISWTGTWPIDPGTPGQVLTTDGNNVAQFDWTDAPNTPLANGQAQVFGSVTEDLTILAAATTDTAILMPAGALVTGVSVRVTTVIPTAATFDIGVAGATTRYGTGISTAVTTTNASAGTTSPSIYATDTAIRITPNAPPAAATGTIRVTAHYILTTPPTS